MEKFLARMAIWSSVLGFSSFANVLDAQEVQFVKNVEGVDEKKYKKPEEMVGYCDICCDDGAELHQNPLLWGLPLC